MKFCLLVTVALDIFIKEKIILLSPLDFSFVIFLCKRCLLGQTKRKGILLTIFSFIKKETPAQVFSCEFCEISKNTFSYRIPAVAASVHKLV